MYDIQEILIKANNLFDSGNYIEAKLEYERILKKKPDMMPVIRGRLALVEFKKKNSIPIVDNFINNKDVFFQVQNSGLWDEQWYVTQYYHALLDMPPNMSPLDYYINEGWKKGHLPSPDFKINTNPFPKDLAVNHITYFLNVLRFEGYHFADSGHKPSPDLISQYVLFRRKRSAKKVVYTCVVGGYNALAQPGCLDFEWDYVCFTDAHMSSDTPYDGVWELRPLLYREKSPSRTNRWHKINPHIAFPEYEESIYIDGNINIVGDYCYEIAKRGEKLILLPRHFKRQCVYEEVRTLKASRRFTSDDKLQFSEQEKFLRDEGFPENYGLGENNVIYRRHHDKKIIAMMNLWQWILNKFSGRDQLGLAYCFWRYGLKLEDYLIENCRINYKNFRVFAHNEKIFQETVNVTKLSPTTSERCVLSVFSCNDTFVPYLAVAIESLVIHSKSIFQYDIVVLYSDLSESNIEKLKTIKNDRNNVSIRFFFMEDLVSSIGNEVFPVDGYVPRETYNKCFLTEIFEGYDRCLYLDSDILICDDISKLYFMDMDSKSIAASRNVANINAAYLNKEIKSVRFRDYLNNVLEISDSEEYFQAGVVLLDLEKLRNWRLLEKSVSALKDIGRPLFYDQCIFNKLFYKDVKFFPTAWNHVWYLQNYSYLKSSMSHDIYYDYAKGRSFPKIVHYASGDKYYNKPDWILADRFWGFVVDSRFSLDVLKDCERRLDSDGYSKLKEIIAHRGWKRQRLLVHLHVYYRDQLPYMLDAIDNISGVDVDLYVTQVERDKLSEALVQERCPEAKILTIGNAGYDVYPFLVVLKQGRLSQYDFILKLHTKNSRPFGQDYVYGVAVPGFTWRNKLVESLLKDKATFLSCLEILRNDEFAGALAAKEFIFDTSENNEERNYNLPYWRGRLGLAYSEHYVGGSMFLAKAYPFEKLLSSGVASEDFSSASYTTKDSKNLGHIFERLLGLVIGSEGLLIHGK